MQALPRQTPTSRVDKASHSGAMDANHAAIALATAMNEARAALAERDEAVEDQREAGVARLQALRGKLAPLYAAIPRDVDLFDLGFVTPEKPRLFVDIIAYVEPGRDGGYRFVQESRSGRKTLLETSDEASLIGEITRYVAHRLVVRERALAQLEESRPGPLIRQPAPLVPMTAEEAFRQWTRGTRSNAEPGDTARTWMQEPRGPTAAADMHAERAAETAMPPEAPSEPVELLSNPAGARQSRARTEESEATGQAPPTPRVRHWPEATPQANRKGQGWWLWPTMALLIGGGLGPC